jgi:hypothetical protein
MLTLGEVTLQNMPELRQIKPNKAQNAAELPAESDGCDEALRFGRLETMVSVQASTDRYLSFGPLCGVNRSSMDRMSRMGRVGLVSVSDDNGG